MSICQKTNLMPLRSQYFRF